MQLPDRPNLEHLRKQAKRRSREQSIALGDAQHRLARDYDFPSWPRLVRHVEALRLGGIERHLAVADPAGLEAVLLSDPEAVDRPVDGLVPILYLLRRSKGTGADVRERTSRACGGSSGSGKPRAAVGPTAEMHLLLPALPGLRRTVGQLGGDRRNVVELAACDPHDEHVRLLVVELKAEAVHPVERDHGSEHEPLVAVDERVAARDGVQERGRLRVDRWVGVLAQVARLRSGEGRLEEPPITDGRWAPEGTLGDVQDLVELEVDHSPRRLSASA